VTDPLPRTIAESSGYRATSRHSDVLHFVDELRTRADPSLLSVQSMGRSALGQEMPVLVLSREGRFTPDAAHAAGRPIVLVVANIHAGEVEGKESLLKLAREVALGSLGRLVDRATLVLVPDFNPDGNDRIDRANRVLDLAKLEGQIGPEQGVGTRNTAAGFNLNRDYVKLDAVESRLLMKLWGSWRPHVTVDCHTTNGSIHGYHLTFDTAHLLPSSPPAPILHVRDELLPAVSRKLEARTGLRTFFYGNFVDHSDPTKGWETYPGLPRFGSHWRGLAGRMDVLLECYSYLDFTQRCHVMFETLVELLDHVHDHGAEIVSIVGAAEAETIRRGENPQPDDELGVSYAEAVRLPQGSLTVRHPIHLLREVELLAWDLESMKERRVPGRELVRYRGPWLARFLPTRTVRRPFAYVIPASEQRIADHLRLQNVVVHELARAQTVAVEQFVVHARARTASPDIADTSPPETLFFGHHEAAAFDAAPGDLVVPMAQPLAHVALYLLEPESDDGLVQWGFFDSLADGAVFPIRRVPRPVAFVEKGS
jgi:hypothetical protein